MAYRDSSYGGFGSSVTPWVKRLLIANTAAFVLLFVVKQTGLVSTRVLYDLVGFAPTGFIFRPWTLLTYAFVHFGIWHLLGNLLVLFFFGPPLEERWGGRGFIRFCAVAAAGAALFASLFAFLQPATWIVGGSGVGFGLMLAFALYWPDMPIHVWGVFPIQAKWFVGILGAIQLYLAVDGSGGGVSVLAHLGGLVTAFAYLRSPWAPSQWGDVPVRRSPRKKAGVLAGWTARAKKAATPGAAAASAQHAGAGTGERQLLDDVDRILDKISEQGLSSLTDAERTRLDEVSKRYRTN